jgi:exodeoxyribonuclease VII small subunit
MTAPTTFADAYQILKTNAEQLENADTLDIDGLVATVEQSIQAYKVCQERISAVEQALQKTFDELPSTNAQP